MQHARPIDQWKHDNGPTPCTKQPTLFVGDHEYDLRSREGIRLVWEAKQICGLCPARQPCYDSSFLNQDGILRAEVGIWGGYTQKERCAKTGHKPIIGTGTPNEYRAAHRQRNRP